MLKPPSVLRGFQSQALLPIGYRMSFSREAHLFPAYIELACPWTWKSLRDLLGEGGASLLGRGFFRDHDGGDVKCHTRGDASSLLYLDTCLERTPATRATDPRRVSWPNESPRDSTSSSLSSLCLDADLPSRAAARVVVAASRASVW